ncbi:alpha/beta fold hydrolase [Streptomyces sp. NPDC051987]|uniref:alpha/beta fold hydrolase n=1 Tax=Streptomyces sp. NPDC051987 TaxID=3155808 RepID=UPI003428CA3F
MPLVLLHALGKDATDWETVVPVLARDRRVYAVDQRGHGRSEWPGHYSLELVQADVLGFLGALELGRVERVRRLVLEDVPVPRPREPTTPVRPDGDLTFDWRWCRPSDGRSTGPIPGGWSGSAGSPPRPWSWHHAAPEAFTEVVSAFLPAEEGPRPDRRP